VYPGRVAESESRAVGPGDGWMYTADVAWWREEGPRWGNLVRDGKLRRTPDAPTMYAQGPEALLEGWLPAEPLIGPETRVIAFGSCFAARFAQWLAEHGYNLGFDSSSDQSIVRSPLETPSVVAQQFRWAFGELDSDLAFWMRPDRQRVEATEEHRLALHETLVQADVIIVTLGLSELWVDTVSGEPIWRVPPRELQDRYAFKVASLAETLGALETIHRIRLAHMPDLKIIYTVSPQRLTATFRGISAIVANTVSKAILRAAVDEFLRAYPEELNAHYFYFPGYEIANELFRDSLFEDNMHIRDRVAAAVLDVFARSYTTEPVTDTGGRFPASVEEELRANIVGLEARTVELGAVCEERARIIEQLQEERRLWVEQPAVDPDIEASRRDAIVALEARIEELQTACDERLAVIEQLDAQTEALQAVSDQRLALIEQLDAQTKALQAVSDQRLALIEQLDADRRRPFALSRFAVRRLRRMVGDRTRRGALPDSSVLQD
jgi:hypothetical protein